MPTTADYPKLRQAFSHYWEEARRAAHLNASLPHMLEPLEILTAESPIRSLESMLLRTSQFRDLWNATEDEIFPLSRANRHSIAYALRDFFRLSEALSAIYRDSQTDPGPYCSRLIESLARERDNITLLIPLGGIALTSDHVTCDGFVIRRFTERELRKLVRWQAREDF